MQNQVAHATAMLQCYDDDASCVLIIMMYDALHFTSTYRQTINNTNCIKQGYKTSGKAPALGAWVRAQMQRVAAVCSARLLRTLR
jgi:hypothetical protein